MKKGNKVHKKNKEILDGFFNGISLDVWDFGTPSKECKKFYKGLEKNNKIKKETK